MGEPRVKVVIYDLGGVLIEWNPRYLYRKLFAGDEPGMERFLTEVWTAEWNLELDRGRTFAEALPELIARSPNERERIEAFRDRWIETIKGPMPDSVAILKRLHAGDVPLWAITNWSAETFPLVRDDPTYAFLGHFRQIFVSGELKVIKPQPAIFEHALAAIGEPAERCLFIDDSAANIAGAEAVGLRTHHFTGAAGLERELGRLGLLA